MAAFIARKSLRAITPIATASIISYETIKNNRKAALCDTSSPLQKPTTVAGPPSTTTSSSSSSLPKNSNSNDTRTINCNTPESRAEEAPQKKAVGGGMIGGGNERGLFYDLFPLRQLWKPSVEYPMWDDNWDGRAVEYDDGTSTKEALKHDQEIRRNGITRHVILIRHGQYDETHKEDEKRILTPLGREQADLTGRRLAEIVEGIDEKFGPCRVKTIRVSNMARAKETADIIAKHLPGIERASPDPLLNEGRPSHHIPCGTVKSSIIDTVDKHHPRIESAFRKYFYRAPYNPTSPTTTTTTPPTNIITTTNDDDDDDTTNTTTPTTTPLKPNPKHEFEIIVCHANVIRYFFCRALQLPPEAWLRLCTFNCSLTYLTIRSTGTVSCRMLGDIGHLGYDRSTFSMHHGFNW